LPDDSAYSIPASVCVNMTNDEIRIVNKDGIDFIIVIKLVVDVIRFVALYAEERKKDMLKK
jgi:hypothetical protein